MYVNCLTDWPRTATAAPYVPAINSRPTVDTIIKTSVCTAVAFHFLTPLFSATVQRNDNNGIVP